MSKYTTELRFICEHLAGLEESEGYTNINGIILKARPKIFDFEYPIFDTNYKSVLETKILKHYYTREIGAETYGLWHLWLDATMNEIMPYYNKLYKSELLDFNPFWDTDLHTERDIDRGGESTNNINEDTTATGKSHTLGNVNNEGGYTNNSDGWNLYSDTPQGGLNGIETNTYLTNATHVTNTDTNTHNDNTASNETNTTENTGERKTNAKNDYTNTEDYLEHVYGNRGGVSMSKRLMEYRETFLNIDRMIINDVGGLFLNLW